jgi:cobalt-zinc-cadmium efflux system outer membrane protein
MRAIDLVRVVSLLAVLGGTARAADDFVAPTGNITLRDALSAALLHNPDLQAFSAEVRAREARALQAGVLPNPTLRAEVEDFAGDGIHSSFKSAQTTISLAQLVELGGKRAKRRRLASLDRDLAGWDYEARRATVLADVTRAFVAALAAEQRLRLSDELIGVASGSVKEVGAHVRAGAVSPIETERAEVALSRTRLDRVEVQHELQGAFAALAASWGSTHQTFESVRGDLDRVTPPAPEETFFAGIDTNPDLARWATELEQRRAAIDLEEAKRIPDVVVGLGGRRFNETETNAAVFELSVPLPLFDRNQGAIAEAQQRLAKARAERAAAETAVRRALTRAYQDLHAAFDRLTSLRDEVIPRARTVYDGARDAWAKGLFRYLEVLDAQRSLFELRVEYVQTLATYHAAAAEVERLSGVPVGTVPTEDDR